MKPSIVFCVHCGASNPTDAKYCFSCGESLQRYASVSVGSEQTGQLKSGDVLRQRYKVLMQIGQGGFGAVYKAEDNDLGQRLVAVKEMSKQNLSLRALADGVESFKREALMLAGLRHQHLPRIYEHFEEEERWYLVMDYIEGETLEDHFAKSRDGRLPQIMALKIALQLCDVLDYLHTRQPPIIFRDLKPANIILTPEGNLFLIDFGIARHFKPGQAKDTSAFGSPGYAAPEQYGKAQTTPRADIYSLGAILHQMLSGSDPSLSPFRFAPLHGQDPALQQLVAQMLEIDESRRPASVAMFKQALKHIRERPASSPLRAGQILPAAPVTRQIVAVSSPFLSIPPELVHEHHYGVVRAVGWSPDSTHAASATEAIVRVWNARNGQNLCSYREHVGLIGHMAWSPTAMLIASLSEENKVRVWDAGTGKTLATYPGDPKPGVSQNIVQWLAWSLDGQALAVAGSRCIYIWDTIEGKISTRLRNRSFSGYRALCWSPDGKCLAAAQGNTVTVYRLGVKPKAVYYRYSAPVNAVAWSPDGIYLAAGGCDRTVHIWDVRNDRFIGFYNDHIKPISALAWAPDSRRIASGSLGPNVNVWDALTGSGIVSYNAHAGDVLTLAWSPDGRSILSGGSDCRVCVWRAP